MLHVLYLIFNEGYAASSGPHVHRAELTGEAIRLTREIHRMLPENGEVAGLLALMLLTDAHRGARTGQDGGLIPLAEQDRGLWDPAAISEGVELISRTLVGSALGPYQLQAAIAAVHADARTAADTDWRQILGLYDLLQHFSASPMIRLNRAIAVAMVSGPRAGLAIVDTLDRDARMATNHRLRAVRAHLLEMAGDLDTARQFYRLAARGTTSIPEQRHLEAHAARLTAPEAPHPT